MSDIPARSRRRPSLAAAGLLAAVALVSAPAVPWTPTLPGTPEAPEAGARLAAQDRTPPDTLPPVGREGVATFEPPDLDFDPPRVQERELDDGTPVLFLEDHTLPLVDVMVRFEGGYAHFGRDHYAVATAMPTLLRTGGTRTLSPDSVDRLMELYALQTRFGAGGAGASAHLNTLTENLDEAVDLWVEMLRSPRFDSSRIEAWRGRAREGVRRRRDSPSALAYSEFNRLMFGDHPTGWGMTEEDLAPEKLTPEAFRWLHRRIFCRENMVLGVSGDLGWERAKALLGRALAGWPQCPAPLPEEETSPPRDDPAVFVIPREVSQSVVIMAEPSGILRSDTAAYAASRIANAILGGGGFTSRLMSRVRTDEGLAYSVSSLWTTPSDEEGVAGAVAQTRADATSRTAALVLEVMREMVREPPTAEEVRTAVDEIANGFVFNFQNAAQIVSRKLLYRSAGLPDDWLQRYVDAVQAVGPEDVHRVVRQHLDPDGMTVLLVGDTAQFDPSPEALGLSRETHGPVRYLEVGSGP